MKLRSKINLYTAALFALVLMTMNLFIYFTFSKLTFSSHMEAAEAEMKKSAAVVAQSLGKIPEAELLRAYVPVDGMIQLVSSDGTGFPTITSLSEQKLAKRPPRYFASETSSRVEYFGRDYSFQSMPIILPSGNVGNLQITTSLEPAVRIVKTLRLVLLLATFVALIPVLVSSAFLGKIIIGPVTSMIQTMSDIRRSGQFKRLHIEVKSKDELYQMGETFNHMIDLLESNFDKQRQFISNASHELKTPITIIGSYSSLLKRRGLQDPKLFEESVDAIHSEAIRMKEMTEQLLLLAKHNEQWNLQMENVDLSSLVFASVKAFENAFNREVILEHPGEPLVVNTDEQKLKQLLFIFLDNARKYSDAPITLSFGSEGNGAFIRVADQGIGIEDDELPRVFDRFYRVDKARNRKIGGSGLGLSLAKEIADALKIQLHLTSKPGVGTTATLYLKKY
ncbi:sensor histidine kinase [Neobacillus notoginsengisoli]|uniref:histidine kinase n=1 Tax=Neobacillus notoginsengisoli TaxID=1578198 RepID=A0A417YPG4_9BACI|nr:HAMP domain-containing sensor histidine kinase [Neobacillus notoginsengisoli]RHW35685.1 sensor histidine kinase [Neobacillus notoginsengisoli]